MALSPFLMPCISRSRLQIRTFLALLTPQDGREMQASHFMSAAASVTRDCLAPSLLSGKPQGAIATRSLNLRQGPYCMRLASSAADRMDAFRLRFLVFNLELNEGLDAAYTTGHDIDEFDAICDHLIVEHAPTGQDRRDLSAADRRDGVRKCRLLQRA